MDRDRKDRERKERVILTGRILATTRFECSRIFMRSATASVWGFNTHPSSPGWLIGYPGLSGALLNGQCGEKIECREISKLYSPVCTIF